MIKATQIALGRKHASRIAIVLVVLLGIVAFTVRTCQLRDRHSGLETTLLWTGLSKYPVPTEQIEIEHRGSLFTREFNVHFQTSPDAVERWLSESDCTATITHEVTGMLRTYKLKPAGGAQFAEVRFDTQTGDVWIRTYWN